MDKQITFGVSVPTEQHRELANRIARLNGRNRSQQITVWIEQAARELGLLPDPALSAKTTPK